MLHDNTEKPIITARLLLWQIRDMHGFLKNNVPVSWLNLGAIQTSLHDIYQQTWEQIVLMRQTDETEADTYTRWLDEHVEEVKVLLAAYSLETVSN